ncbi:MAG: NADPH-dependent F420 reductase [Dehalococcoidia bacterium]
MAQTIGFIGGTGPEGKGLAARFALAGMEVILGSRSTERGQEAANDVLSVSGGTVRGATNEETARSSDIIVLTVPYSGLADTLGGLVDAIGDKIVVSAVVPLQFAKGRVTMLGVEEGSASEQAQRILANAKVVGAYHNLAAGHLIDVEHAMEGDVLVCGDDADAVRQVIWLSEQIRDLRGVNCGPLSSSHYIEGVTALLININRNYKKESGVQIVGI